MDTYPKIPKRVINLFRKFIRPLLRTASENGVNPKRYGG